MSGKCPENVRFMSAAGPANALQCHKKKCEPPADGGFAISKMTYASIAQW